MNTVIEEMLKKYDLVTLDDKVNALKEIIQEIVLCGLYRANFFNEAVFYGGTALRIFYGLDRFSEDLDFSLKNKNLDFNLEKYFPVLKREINSFGLNLIVEEKEKSIDTNIKSAFVKGNEREHMLIFYSDNEIIKHLNNNQNIKIKFKVDTFPPDYANFEHKYKLYPNPYEVMLYDLPSLFAGKIAAVLSRTWKNRIKGRDLYDYVFYLQKNITFNLKHLKARLVQSKYISDDFNLTLTNVIDFLNKRFIEIDYESAKKDVINFIKDTTKIDMWCSEFFIEITKLLKSN